MSSRGYQNEASLQPWLTLAIGLIVGQQTSNQQAAFVEQFYWFVDNALVPLYTGFVITYLSALVVQRHVLPFTKRCIVPSDITKPEVEELEDDEANDEGDNSAQPINMSGKYKLVSVENFDKFLEVQGVPWPLRRAACKARPIHRITHRGNRVTIRIEGLIVTQTTYVVNGPPVEINIRGRIFQDRMIYLENGQGIQGIKRAVTENYDVIVDRVLSEDKSKITLTGRALFKDGRETVESVQIFERVE